MWGTENRTIIPSIGLYQVFLCSGLLATRELAMEIKELIGAPLKDIGNKKGENQGQLSEMVGINPKYLSSIERGKENPTLNTILKLAETLDVGLDEIFDSIDVEEPKNRRALIDSLLDKADDEQRKLVYRIV